MVAVGFFEGAAGVWVGMTRSVHTIAAKRKTWQMEDPGGTIGRYFRQGRPYEPALLADVSHHQLSGSAIDIGAHVGNHSVYFAVACGLVVHAFEGDQQLLPQLHRNIERNELQNRITVWETAVGAKTGRGEWYLDEKWGAGTKANKRLRLVDDGPVPVNAIDDLLFLDDLVLVKLDIEGGEPDALAGMIDNIEANRPLIYAETHRPDLHEATAAILEPLGYRTTGRFEYANRMVRWECNP